VPTSELRSIKDVFNSAYYHVFLAGHTKNIDGPWVVYYCCKAFIDRLIYSAVEEILRPIFDSILTQPNPFRTSD